MNNFAFFLFNLTVGNRQSTDAARIADKLVEIAILTTSQFLENYPK
jgi:hypothetical protein